MVKRLNFRGIDEFERGTELCRLVGKPVAENPRAIATLADVLDFFLQEWVAKKQWDSNEVRNLIEDPNNRDLMVQLINAYGDAAAKNLWVMAGKDRNMGIR